jgi:hypothetical protein
MRAVSSVLSSKYEVFDTAFGANKLWGRESFVFQCVTVFSKQNLSALVEWAGRLSARGVFPISGFRPQLAELEFVQLEPGTTDFGRRRA